MKSKFSFILPVYNVEKYIKKCVDSLLNQTYENFEVILINDGSKDKSEDVCKEMVKKDSRVSLYNQVNSGVSVARNLGIDKSSGDWLVFIDPDDWVDKDYLLNFYNSIEENVDIIICDDIVEFPKKSIINNIFIESCEFVGNKKDDLLLQFFSKNSCSYFPQNHDCSSPWGKIYRKEFVLKNGIRFEPELRRAQDKVFNLYAFELASTIKYINIPQYHYRMNETSTWGKYSPNIINDLEKLYEHMRKFILKYKTDNDVFLSSFYEKIALSINSIFRQYYYHKDCELSNREKKKEIDNFLHEGLFKEALVNIDLKKLSFQEKVFIIFVKIRKYGVCDLLIKLRRKFMSGR